MIHDKLLGKHDFIYFLKIYSLLSPGLGTAATDSFLAVRLLLTRGDLLSPTLVPSELGKETRGERREGREGRRELKDSRGSPSFFGRYAPHGWGGFPPPNLQNHPPDTPRNNMSSFLWESYNPVEGHRIGVSPVCIPSLLTSLTHPAFILTMRTPSIQVLTG